MTRRLLILGSLMLIPYAYALSLGNLRQHTFRFLVAFFAAFVFYALASWIVLRAGPISKPALASIFIVPALAQGLLLYTQPRLSDDMYRYIWDGRVQAQGISPYRDPPNSPDLAFLRDDEVWPLINRKFAVTIYPPAAQAAFAFLWKIWPDRVQWFQFIMAAGGLFAGVLLVRLLQALEQPVGRVLIYLWSPLLAFETAHSAHIDGLILPIIVGAWWARVKERDSLVGVLLGLGAAMKLYPALLLPALWRPNHPRGRWSMPLAFALTFALCYLPYVLTSGAGVIGYLPRYFGEQSNLSPLAVGVAEMLMKLGVDPRDWFLPLTLIFLAVVALRMAWRPAPNGAAAIRRSIWLIGPFILLSINLLPWYLLWLLPLLAIFLPAPGEKTYNFRFFWLNAWTGWCLFCGLVVLSYTSFTRWGSAPAVQGLEFLPLYLFLLAESVRKVGGWIRNKGLLLNRRYRVSGGPGKTTGA